jgi:hypothetical protein
MHMLYRAQGQIRHFLFWSSWFLVHLQTQCTVTTFSYHDSGSFLPSIMCYPHITARYTTVDDCHSNVIDALQTTDSYKFLLSSSN